MAGDVTVVLVTEGDERAALAVVRSLGARGCTVHVCSASGRSLAGASRHCANEFAVGEGGGTDYGARVLAIAGECDADILIPITETSLRVLLPMRAEFEGVRIPFPDEDTFRTVSDKERLLEVAREVGIRVPAQSVVASADDVRGFLGGSDVPALPVVMKPSRSVAVTTGRANPGVRYADTPGQLAQQLAEYPETAFPLLVQERVTGTGMGVFLLTWDGHLRASFMHRRVREKPPSGGVSVCRESGSPDPALVEASLRLLTRVGWNGVAMVEYKRDGATGEPVLMEVNGRFWGSLQLAIDAGVDFPSILLDSAEGGPPPGSPPEWRHVRLRWIWGEVDHLLARLRGGGPGMSPSDRPVLDRVRAVREVVSWSRGDRTEVFRWSDRRPFARETAQRLRWWANRLLGRSST